MTPALQAATDFRLDLPTHGSPYLALLTHVDLHDAAQAWRPWRGYGVIRAWSSLV